MRFLIPSFHRCGACTSAVYLHECGVPREQIIIGTQTEDDYEAYSYKYDRIATVTYREAHNCAGNRNNLLELAEKGEPVVLMDDDIRKMQRYDVPKKGHGVATDLHGEGFARAVETLQRIKGKAGARIAGIASHSNGINLERMHRSGKKWETNKLLSGMFIVVDGGHRLFDEGYDCLDDFELCLRTLQSGGKTLRANWLIASKPQDTTNRGGCRDVYDAGGKAKVLQRLEREYGGIAKAKKDGTGMQLRSGLR